MNRMCTCEQCERHRQRLEDEAFADMVVLAHWHPEWFDFDHDHSVHEDVWHEEPGLDDDLGFWD